MHEQAANAMQQAATKPVRLDTTLVKGLNILTALCRAAQPLGVAALANQLDTPRAAVHRLLQTLMRLELVQQDPLTKRYFATLKIWEKGSIVAERSPLKSSSRAVLRRLSTETGETTFLSVLSGTDILYLEKIEMAANLPSMSQAGLRVPALFPASGRVLLAHQPNARELVETTVASEPRAAGMDVGTIIAELEHIRRDGYATSVSGWTKGAASIAVAVSHPSGVPRAAIGIGLPTARFDPARLPEFAPLLFQYSAQLADITRHLI